MSQTSQVQDIVLVHGAFASASSWSKVVPLLRAKGYRVTSVHCPLTSFKDDVDVTKHAIAAQDGPTILVGHSYGGVVITEAGNDPKVVGLVYVAAFAPDAGQSILDISKDYPKPIGLEKLVPQAEGFLLLSQDGIETAFAQDLSEEEKALLIADQPPTHGSIFAAQPTQAAWHSKPSRYMVAANDHMIAPEQQADMALRIGATMTSLSSSHVAMLSHPVEVAKVIDAAAAGTR
jgi:pimeloyl-ACP methyl ester carboxylesterase